MPNVARQLFRQELGPRYNLQRVRSNAANRRQTTTRMRRQVQVRNARQGRNYNRGVRRSGRGRMRGRVINNRFVPY